jgi:hypothetical protein
MTNDTSPPDRTPRIIATFWIVVALVGGASAVAHSTRTAPAVSVTTTCSQFAADAEKSFKNGANVTLTGPFAVGDHVHLAIDFKGIGYSWQATGVLGAAKTDVTGSGWFETDTTFTETMTKADRPMSTTTVSFDAAASATGISISSEPPDRKYNESRTVGESHGDVNGVTRLNVDVEVAATGDGAITISQKRSLLLAVSQKVAIANCTSANQTPVAADSDSSSNPSVRSLSAPLG